MGGSTEADARMTTWAVEASPGLVMPDGGDLVIHDTLLLASCFPGNRLGKK